MTAKKLIYTVSMVLTIAAISILLSGCKNSFRAHRTGIRAHRTNAVEIVEVPSEANDAADTAAPAEARIVRTSQAHTLEGTVVNAVSGTVYYCWEDGNVSLTEKYDVSGLIWTHPWGESVFNIYAGLISSESLVYSEHTCTQCGIHNTYYLSLVRTDKTANFKNLYLCESCHEELRRTHIKCCKCSCYYDKNSAITINGCNYCGYCGGSNNNGSCDARTAAPASNPLSAYASVLEHIRKLSSKEDPSFTTEGLLYDINDDGTDELIIFFLTFEENIENRACAVYTVQNGEAVCILEPFLLQPEVGGANEQAQIVRVNGEACLLLTWGNSEWDVDKIRTFGESKLFTFNGKELECKSKAKYDVTYSVDQNTGALQLIENESTVYHDSSSIRFEDYKNWLSGMKVLSEMDGYPSCDEKEQGYSLSEMEALFAS